MNYFSINVLFKSFFSVFQCLLCCFLQIHILDHCRSSNLILCHKQKRVFYKETLEKIELEWRSANERKVTHWFV